MRWATVIAMLVVIVPAGTRAQSGPLQRASIPRYQLVPHDVAPLPIGGPGDFATGIFGCLADHTVFVTMVTKPSGSQAPTPISLYGIHGATDVVRFNTTLAPGFRDMGPIYRYFPSDTKIVALAYGDPIGYSDLDRPRDPVKDFVPVLLTFDREGKLLDSAALSRALNPRKVALFPSGDILILRWDDENRRTSLVIVNSKGTIEREMPIEADDPAQRGYSKFGTALVGMEIYSWGQHLLLVPDGAMGPIVEVSETGVVNTWKLHVPKGYERGIPIAFDPHTWIFRMVPRKNRT